MAKYQGHPSETVLFLATGSIPATGVLFSQLTVRIRKAGETIFTPKTLISADWVNLGSGHYALKWSAADMNKLGAFLFTISGVGFNNVSYGSFDVDSVPLPLTAAPDTCIISGNIQNIGGDPLRSNRISMRPAGYPMATDTSIVAADAVTTTPDVFGNFQFIAIQGKSVAIELERTGIKIVIDVPFASSAALLDLIPTLPN